jgi:hypothetical protein
MSSFWVDFVVFGTTMGGWMGLTFLFAENLEEGREPLIIIPSLLFYPLIGWAFLRSLPSEKLSKTPLNLCQACGMKDPEVMYQCKHSFHVTCASVTDQCPTCKKKISKETFLTTVSYDQFV